MAAINTSATRSDRRNIHDSPPGLLKHMRDSKFRYNERASEIDINRVIPFLKLNFEDIAHSLAIAGIHDQNVGMLAVLLFDFVE